MKVCGSNVVAELVFGVRYLLNGHAQLLRETFAFAVGQCERPHMLGV
jgi:hypothetical protein